jgi:hypothetical protein
VARAVGAPAQFDVPATFEHAVQDGRGEIGIVQDATPRLSFAKTSSRLSGRRPTLSRQAKERLGDCRPEGGQQGGSVGPPPKDAGPFVGCGGEQPDGRTGPIVANRLSWIRPPVGRSGGGGHRLRESR